MLQEVVRAASSACVLLEDTCVPTQTLRATSTFPPRVVRARAERKTLSWNALILETKRNCSNPKTLEHVNKQKRVLPRLRWLGAASTFLRSAHAQHGRAMQRLDREMECIL